VKSQTTALVTGGAGFIGSHIVDALVGRGMRTIVIDDFSSGSLKNLQQHDSSDLLEVVKGDVLKAESLLEGRTGIDVVFHEAAIANVQKSVEDPGLVHSVNVDGTMSVLNFCRTARVKKLVFASSAAVYGALGDQTASEGLLCSPASPYGASKLAAEDYLGAFYRTYGLKTVGLRYFNVYGPRQKLNDYSGVITVFTKALLSGTTPTIYGDGEQSRDFVHVKDIVQANMLAMDSDDAAGRVFNVASGASIRIIDLLEILKEILGKAEVTPRFAPARVGDVRSGAASIERIRGLGYRPSVALREGLAELADYLRREVEPRIPS
jgi:UDP-glucose 4-epimerase